MNTQPKESENYRLTVAEIHYQSAENPDALQSLIWQDYDLAPDYPELRKFLSYWARHIDGVVQSVRVAGDESPRRAIYPQASTTLH